MDELVVRDVPEVTRMAPTIPGPPTVNSDATFLKKHVPLPTPLIPPSYVKAIQSDSMSQRAKQSSKESGTSAEPYAPFDVSI